MKRVKYTMFLVMILLVFSTGCQVKQKKLPHAVKGALDVRQWDFVAQGIVPLHGEWELYWNELLTPEDFESGELIPQTYITLPASLEKVKIGDIALPTEGYATIRLKVKVKDGQTLYGLKTGNMLLGYQVWVNGQKTVAVGQVGTNRQEEVPLLLGATSSFVPLTNEVEIIAQMSNFRSVDPTIKSMKLGLDKQIRNMTSRSLMWELFLFGSLLMTGLYHLSLFILRNKNGSALYFSIVCILIAVRIGMMGEFFIIDLFPSIPFEIYHKLGYLAGYLCAPLFVVFLKQLFWNEFDDRVIRFVKWTIVLSVLFVFGTDMKIYGTFMTHYGVFTIMLSIYATYSVLKAANNKRPMAWTVLLGALPIVVAAFNDIAKEIGLITTPSILSPALFFFIFFQSYILAQSFTLAFIRSEKLAEENEEMVHNIRNLNEELEKKVEERTKDLQETMEELTHKSQSVKNLLDHAGQGFMSFGSDLIIHEEYSVECRNILETELAGKKISEVLFPQDLQQRSFLEEALYAVEERENLREIYLSLLPEEVVYGHKYIQIEYRVLGSSMSLTGDIVFMVILTDISQKRELESQIEMERNQLRMIVKAVVNHQEFLDILKEYKYFCTQQIYELIGESCKEGDMIEVFRKIHTYKGVFSQYEMSNTVKHLHRFETHLSDAISTETQASQATDCLMQSFCGMEWIEEDVQVLKNTLGDHFFEGHKMYMVDEDKIGEIEKHMLYTLSPREYKILLPEVRKLRYQSFKQLLRGYSDYTARLAERMNKKIHEVRIEGAEVPVDIRWYKAFSKSLIHVFRNMVDHGIESMDDRLSQGKSEIGTIKCSTSMENEYIRVCVEDDGRGLDRVRLLQKAVEKGLITLEEAEALSEEETYRLIFEDQFSTKDEITDLSGRGVGLGAVMKETTLLGGSIQVSTVPHKGTTFEFLLPLIEEIDVPELPITIFMESIIQKARGFLQKDLGIAVDIKNHSPIYNKERLDLEEITCFINMKGIIEGKFMISMDKELAKNTVRSFVIDEISEEEVAEYMEDTLAECSNTILGNTFHMMPEIEQLMNIDSPATIRSKKASIKYPGDQIWYSRIITSRGNMYVGVIMNKRS